jgi:hypothetical protein
MKKKMYGPIRGGAKSRLHGVRGRREARPSHDCKHVRTDVWYDRVTTVRMYEPTNLKNLNIHETKMHGPIHGGTESRLHGVSGRREGRRVTTANMYEPTCGTTESRL